MRSRDFHNNSKVVRVLSPIALTTTLGSGAKIVSRAGYEGLEFVVNVGTRTTTAGSVSFIMKEGDVTGTLTSVADADMTVTEASIAIAAATPLVSGTHKNMVRRIGYLGRSPYVTLISVPAAMTSCIVGIEATLSAPHVAPAT